jgi:hypothetical protein
MYPFNRYVEVRIACANKNGRIRKRTAVPFGINFIANQPAGKGNYAP